MAEEPITSMLRFKEDGMSATAQPAKVLVSRAASDYAFRIGQLVNRILIRRAIGIAGQENADTITITEDHIKSSLDDSLVSELVAQLEDAQNGGGTEAHRLSA